MKKPLQNQNTLTQKRRAITCALSAWISWCINHIIILPYDIIPRQNKVALCRPSHIPSRAQTRLPCKDSGSVRSVQPFQRPSSGFEAGVPRDGAGMLTSWVRSRVDVNLKDLVASSLGSFQHRIKSKGLSSSFLASFGFVRWVKSSTPNYLAASSTSFGRFFQRWPCSSSQFLCPPSHRPSLGGRLHRQSD